MGGKIPRRIAEDLKRKICKAGKILLFLDYDGTLSPIRKEPGLARLGSKTRSLLKRLSRRNKVQLFIISGRALRDIKKLIRIKSITYSGNHGIELEGPHYSYINPRANAIRPEIQKYYKILKRAIRIKGAIIENKIYTLSVHYRMVGAAHVDKIEEILSRIKFSRKVKVARGKKVFEIRPSVDWDKGEIVKMILKKNGKFTLPIYIGDDITDEDAFRALGKRGASVLVSRRRRKTAARYSLGSTGEVLALLEFIYESMDKKS